MIKVVHLSSAHGDRDVRIFLKECASLAAFNDAQFFEVHQILTGVEEREELGVLIHSVKKYPNQRFKRMWTTVNDVYKKALALDADIYHLHDPELLRIALKLKRKGKTVIYDAHEDLPRQILGKPYLKFKGIISFLVERYENFITKRLDGIVTATPFIRDRFIKINSNTIDINNFPILDELDAVKRNVVNSKSVCYVGGITKVRGIFELLEALDYADFDLFIAGPFESEFLQTSCEQHKNWSKVHYLGTLNRMEVAELYSKTAIGMVTLHPIVNYLDSLPIKMFEYMYTGLATVASNFDLWKEIVAKNNCGLCVDPLKPKEIANAITWLIEHHLDTVEMGKNGQHLVINHYNWEIEKNKLFAFYIGLVNKKP